jgi:DNA-binding GntR family transcriptional regulator
MTARQIADDLASRITAGEYQPGAQLHYGELAELYGVSRAVIKRAVGLLRFRGLAVDWQGRGVFVPHSNGGPTPPKPEPE